RPAALGGPAGRPGTGTALRAVRPLDLGAAAALPPVPQLRPHLARRRPGRDDLLLDPHLAAVQPRAVRAPAVRRGPRRAALGVREVRWSTMVWGGGGGGVAAAVNAAAAAVACGQAENVIVYRGITEADDGRQSYGKGHFPPLLSAHGVLTPVQVCALRTQRMLEVDGVPWSALEALVQASYDHAQRNPDAVGYGRPLDHETYAG